ncbi:hypothetical protein V1478_002286 [Vespula squamosa]|uniref:Uncharacterized protein n=1 Tax=Vespula squamosa TaxID=30214 RepID=A0ABD2BVV2_VESSQ
MIRILLMFTGSRAPFDLTDPAIIDPKTETLYNVGGEQTNGFGASESYEIKVQTARVAKRMRTAPATRKSKKTRDVCSAALRQDRGRIFILDEKEEDREVRFEGSQ